MGQELDHKPAPSSTSQPAARQQAAIPKTKDPIDLKHPMDDVAIDNGNLGPCEGSASGGQCVLLPQQRTALVNNYAHRVTQAHDAYARALDVLNVEQLLRHTEELPWYVSVVLSVASTLVESAVNAAVRSATTSVAARSVKRVVRSAEAASDARAIAFGSKDVVKTGVAAGKQALTAPLGRGVTTDSEATEDKAAALQYIKVLKDAATLRFKAYREVPPATATDLELKTLYDAFDDALHQQTMYEEQLRESVQRFVDSTASKLGRRLAWDDKRDLQHVELETRVAWLITRGAGKRLIYVDRAFAATYQLARQQGATSIDRGSAYDSGTHQLSLRDDATWSILGVKEVRHESPIGPDVMINYVEPEFCEMALQMQDQIWLAPPETFMLDYSKGFPKMVKVAS